MSDERDLRAYREALVRRHMESENVHDFDTTIATFGTALDITLAELALEAFLPADAATANVLFDAFAAPASA